ncbi:MAG: hypothetical protein GYA65_02680 [Actinobacteria bacterium]|nr:hypothetical protein [Ilumatobacteraceae bacterium]NMD23067.1 hypothetical protein [Actinomycetota bacterium]MBP7889546.1 hypothetical protein [Ilumatobacteraceae bacterium]MBP8211106.1 hypothetical protein [Ilumatobacteraceae bacterium]HQY15141.1 hypothetical protein [Ilumatobacteraceae bacterium]
MDSDDTGTLPASDDAPVDETVDVDVDVAAGEEVAIELAPISDPIGTARRRHGLAGGMLAAGMFGIDVALGRKPKEEAPVVVAASDQPIDIDTDGIEIPIDERTSVFAPPQPPTDPLPRRRRKA